MPRLAARIVSVLCVFALVAASAGVTAAVILCPRGVAQVASNL